MLDYNTPVQATTKRYEEIAALQARIDTLEKENAYIKTCWQQDKEHLEKVRHELSFYLDIIAVDKTILKPTDKIASIVLAREIQNSGEDEHGRHIINLKNASRRAGIGYTTMQRSTDRLDKIGLFNKRTTKTPGDVNRKGDLQWTSEVAIKEEPVFRFPHLYTVDEEHELKIGGNRIQRCDNPACQSSDLVETREVHCRKCGKLIETSQKEVNDAREVDKERQQEEDQRIAAIFQVEKSIDTGRDDEENIASASFCEENFNLIDKNTLLVINQIEKTDDQEYDTSTITSVNTGGGHAHLDTTPEHPENVDHLDAVAAIAEEHHIFQLEKSWEERFALLCAIPGDMLAEKRWCVFKFEDRAPGKKPAKVPYIADIHSRARITASSSDAATWRTGSEAMDVLLASREQGWKYPYDGIMMAMGNGWVCSDIDLDKQTGKLDKEATALLCPTYTEYSFNGGIHQFFKDCILPRSRHLHDIELYSEHQFVAVTGDRWHDMPDTAQNCQDALDALYGRVVTQGCDRQQQTEIPPRVYEKAGNALMLDEEALQDACDVAFRKATHARNSEKFLTLWHGDYSGYASQSEADVALCAMIGYYCDYNESVMDALFRQSEMCNRDKWDECHSSEKDTYGAITLQFAIARRQRYETPDVTAEARKTCDRPTHKEETEDTAYLRAGLFDL